MFMPPSLAPLLLADLDEGGGGRDGIAPGVVGDIMSLLPAFEEDFADLEPLHILSKSVSSGTSTLSMVWRMPVHCKRENGTSCTLENCLSVQQETRAVSV